MTDDADLVELLPAGHSVGSIRTRRPLMYVFSGGNEDAAFFSVNGFSILLDGGDQRNVPYWNLIRNYDKISTAVVTRMSPKCLQGISAILKRKCLQECHPNFGSIICNLPPPGVANGDSEAGKVLRAMHEGLRAEGLKPIEAYVTAKMEPITLYEVIGEGALRMIVLNPEKGSKDLTSLMHALKTDENIEKFAPATSLALLLVWHPADRAVPVTRILITGSCPLEKLYASLEKLKGEEYLRYPEFAPASKDREKGSAAGRTGRIIRKAPSTSSTGKVPSALTPGRPAPLQSSTSAPATRTSAESPLKKVTKQPLLGAALPRVAAAAAPKKPTATPPAKPSSSVGGSRPDNKTGNKTGKPAVNGTEKNTTPGSKPKEAEKAKKPANNKPGEPANNKPGEPANKKPEEKSPETKQEHAQGPVPVPVDIPNADIPKNPSAPGEDLPDASQGPQKTASPTSPQNSPVTKSPPSPEAPELPSSPFAPQIPDDNGLLDGIEEPMQVRRISMDFTDEDKEFMRGLQETKKSETSEQRGLDLMDTSVPPQETPLLDSTPLSPSAPHPVAPSPDAVVAAAAPNHDASSPDMEKELYHHGNGDAEEPEEADDEELAHKREIMHKKSIQELLGSGAPPVMAGLITGLVVDSPATPLQQISPMNIDESENSKSPITPPSLNELNNLSSPEREHVGNVENDEKSSKPQIEREMFSLRSNVSSDSVNAELDPALDQVIDSLADASELVDNDARAEAVAGLEHHAEDIATKLIDNAKEAKVTAPETITDAALMMEQQQQQQHHHHTMARDAPRDERYTGIVHDINDNANALANQNAYEAAHAEEMYLPPMTSTVRTRAKPPVNGVKIKPKISHPLYFDIVFVPHHGAHPLLKDEEAAKAFVTSVRSRRYIMSGKDSIRTSFIDGLIAGKTGWSKPELEVDVLPTHDSDELTLYSHEKAGEMAESGISLRCSVERCTLRLSSGGTDDVCAAFKFEM